MRWMNVRKTYPNQWLVIKPSKRIAPNETRIDKISVLESCNDGVSAMQQYRKLHKNTVTRFYLSTPADLGGHL